jgi:CubicO group peptidase (beta-lactamase class C family)
MLRLLAVCASLVLAGDCFAQDRPRDVSGALRAIREKQDVPALAGAVVEHGKVTALGADGVRKRGGKEAVTTGDLFHLGSDTKAMTATMLATLVEEGKLKWTTTVGEVFGDLTMDEQWKAVTLEQLLWHRGGAPTGLETGGLWGRLWKFKGAPAEARMELVKGVLKNPPHPVGKYEYSNAGYAMAGAMAERVMKKSWEELMRERVFRPLGMGSAGFNTFTRTWIVAFCRFASGEISAITPSYLRSGNASVDT